MTLNELINEHRQVSELLDDEEFDEDSALEMMWAVEGDIREKLINCTAFIMNEQANANILGEEIKRLTARKRTRDNLIKKLKERMYEAMKETGIAKVDDDPRFKISYQKNPASVVIRDEAKVPEQFRIHQPDTFDKKELLKWMKQNEVQETDWAVIQQTESLRIR